MKSDTFTMYVIESQSVTSDLQFTCFTGQAKYVMRVAQKQFPGQKHNLAIALAFIYPRPMTKN